ncbi:hypothetical protein FALCPG4_011707 [Fusarium falciforme]
MSSATYSPTTGREEARVHVVTNDKKFNPTLSQLLGLDGESWWSSVEIKTSEKPPSWIWFHLPAVNKGWLSDLIWKLQTKEMIPRWESDNEEGGNGVVSFLHETFSGKRIVELPRFDKPNESGDATFSIAMNFLDSEDSRIYHERDNKIARRRLAQIDLGDPDGRSLLISRSLDESFSVTTGDEDDLNHDQVVFRYYNYYRAGKLSDGREDQDSKRKRAVASRILMVSPLRLWKIGRDVVITAFPAKYNENSNSQFTTFDNVHQSATRSHPQNAMELVSKIMASLVTIVDAPYYAGLHESLLTMLEFDTSAQMAKQLDIFKKFQQRARGGSESQPSSALESITSEVECFRVIMDIRDERAMISSVFSEQERAIHTVMRTFEKLMKDPAANTPRDQLHEAELGIALWVKRLSNIDQRAQVVEKALGHLLNLKLEVSNLAAAEGTKELLESNQYATPSSVVT